MTESARIQILPYTRVVAQETLQLALELAYIAPRIGGVLISGQRGTGKSTAVRAFAQMVHGRLPVTLPINATEDRVVGGWKIDELMRGRAREQRGLLEEANGSLLYVDEVNLLEDHIVNLILDVTSTGVLVVQREGRRDQKHVSFTLVGTMNPEEGWLRPQLRDRFGLMVAPEIVSDRRKILEEVLRFDQELFRLGQGQSSTWLVEERQKEEVHRSRLERARELLHRVEAADDVDRACAGLAEAFKAEGHRGEYVMALAARAYVAREAALHGREDGDLRVTTDHVRKVARLALQHRRPEAAQGQQALWNPEKDNALIEDTLNQVKAAAHAPPA
jgi:magnesium chelatase subunit I